MANLLVVDSQTAMRMGIKILISARYPDCTIYEFKTASDLIDANLEIVPEIIMLGVDIENGNVDLNQMLKIRTMLNSSPLVIYGEYLSNSKIESMFNAGIRGYLSRKSSDENFIECFEAIRMGVMYGAPTGVKAKALAMSNLQISFTST
jgi:DNA-binding NarL/FixJ family response regulator